jgi:transposase-like protein
MKTEVYRWRLSPHLKSELQEAARAERKSMADLLEEIVRDWLRNTRDRTGTEEERQQRVREAALQCAGTVEGSPDLAENARSDRQLIEQERQRDRDLELLKMFDEAAADVTAEDREERESLLGGLSTG